MNSELLLTTKLYIPPVRPELVPRPRLVERLDAGLHRKLTLISAPAGFGKTTLLSEWVAGYDQPVAWLSLDEGDNDPARFLAYLVAALRTVEERIGEGTLAALQSPRPPPLERLLTVLINEVNVAPDAGDRPRSGPQERFILVFDDYHLITAQPIHDALTFLLDHLPGNMHLVIATRADPPLPIARLRGRGQLTELRLSDLRFTLDEMAAFLTQVMGLALTADDIAALATRTEGWIAGLQLAALALHSAVSMRRPEDIAGFIQAFTGSDRHILDYLVEEVIQHQPPAVQAFLLHTSILDQLSGPLCDAVIGDQPLSIREVEQTDKSSVRRVSDSPSGEILAYLERNNLFVVPLDNERRWYRYHHLFADLLSQRLHEAQPDLVPILHGRASAWYEQHGRMDEAIGHALSAGDLEWAAHLTEQAAESTMLRSQLATLQGWVEALPDEMVLARPLLCVYHAIGLLLSGRPLDAVEARLQDATAADAAGSVAGEVTVLRGLLAAYRGEIRQSAELSERALELLPEDSLFFRSFVAGYLGLAHLYGGDAAAARSAFAEAVRISQQVGNLTNAVLAMYHLADLRALQGQLPEAQALYEEALELAVDRQGRRQPIAGIALVGVGRLLRERNDLEGATRALSEGIELIKRWGEVGALSGYIGLARVRQAQGDAECARRAMQAAEQLAIKFDAMKADDIMVAIYQVRLWLAQGDLEAAARWVEERGLERAISQGELDTEAHGAPLPLLRLYEYVTLAHVYVARSRLDEALSVLAHLQRVVEDGGWTTLLIQVLILQALALDARGDVAQAVAPLDRALSLAEPGGFVRVFVDEGEPMARLLRHAASRGVALKYVSGLLAAFDASDRGRAGEGPPHPRAQLLVEPLTERELEVLRLLVTHLSSTEIAEELVVSANTVRSHIKSIYSKLNVHSRADAVQRARELKLL
jgi:LuxR family maltose regulon positive regulatory protein